MSYSLFEIRKQKEIYFILGFRLYKVGSLWKLQLYFLSFSIKLTLSKLVVVLLV